MPNFWKDLLQINQAVHEIGGMGLVRDLFGIPVEDQMAMREAGMGTGEYLYRRTLLELQEDLTIKKKEVQAPKKVVETITVLVPRVWNGVMNHALSTPRRAVREALTGPTEQVIDGEVTGVR